MVDTITGDQSFQLGKRPVLVHFIVSAGIPGKGVTSGRLTAIFLVWLGTNGPVQFSRWKKLQIIKYIIIIIKPLKHIINNFIIYQSNKTN